MKKILFSVWIKNILGSFFFLNNFLLLSCEKWKINERLWSRWSCESYRRMWKVILENSFLVFDGEGYEPKGKAGLVDDYIVLSQQYLFSIAFCCRFGTIVLFAKLNSHRQLRSTSVKDNTWFIVRLCSLGVVFLLVGRPISDSLIFISLNLLRFIGKFHHQPRNFLDGIS